MKIPSGRRSICRPSGKQMTFIGSEAAGISDGPTCETFSSLACNDTEGYESMNWSATVMRRGIVGALAASTLGFATATTVALPAASAAPCTAGGLASTASGVMADAGTYLAAHPEADDVLTKAGTQSTDEAHANVQSYFTAHPGEYLDLKRIAAPLTDLRAQCGVAVSPGQLASLVESFQ